MADDLTKPSAGLPKGERREAPRYPFVATAEQIELMTDTRLTARVSELSVKGCFLDSLNPFLEGTKVKVVIVHGNETFSTLGKVIHCQPNLGMGIAFSVVAPNQQEILNKRLAEKNAGG